jgi:hypothetical protein
MRRFSIPSRIGSSVDVTLFCGFQALLREPMKM